MALPMRLAGEMVVHQGAAYLRLAPKLLRRLLHKARRVLHKAQTLTRQSHRLTPTS